MSVTLEAVLATKLSSQDFSLIDDQLMRKGFLAKNEFHMPWDFLSRGYVKEDEAIIVPHAHFIQGPLYYSGVPDPEKLLEAYATRDKYNIYLGPIEILEFVSPIVAAGLGIAFNHPGLFTASAYVIGGVVVGIGLVRFYGADKVLSAISPAYKEALKTISEANDKYLKATGKNAVVQALKLEKS